MFTRSALTHATVTTVTTVTVIAAIAVSAPVASGREAGTSTDRSPQSSVLTGSPYAEPLAALGGRTMAQYLAAHMEHRLSRL